MGQNEEVWKQVFQELIQEVKPWHKWTLRLDESLLPGIQKRGWTQYQQWGFARFQFRVLGADLMATVALGALDPLKSAFEEALVWDQKTGVLVLPLTPTGSLGMTSSQCVLHL